MRLTHVWLLALALATPVFSATPAHAAETAAAVKARLDARDPGALAAAEALAKADAKNATAWTLLTRARVNAGNQAEAAVKAGERATRLAPRDAQAHRWLGTAYSQRIGEVGMLGKLSIAPKLRDAFEMAVKLDGNLLEARTALVEYYLQAPGAVGGGIDKARAQQREIARRDSAQGFLAHGRIALHEKRNGDALEAYRSALAARPGDERIRHAVASAYQHLERWPEAFALFRTWAREAPDSAYARYGLGRAAALSGQHGDEGVAALQAFIGMPHAPDDPENKHAYYRLGQIHAKAGRKDPARAAFQVALKLDPKFAEAREALEAL